MKKLAFIFAFSALCSISVFAQNNASRPGVKPKTAAVPVATTATASRASVKPNGIAKTATASRPSAAPKVAVDRVKPTPKAPSRFIAIRKPVTNAPAVAKHPSIH